MDDSKGLDSPSYRIIVRHIDNTVKECVGTYSIHKNYVHIREVNLQDGRHIDVIVPFSSLLRLRAIEQRTHPLTGD